MTAPARKFFGIPEFSSTAVPRGIALFFSAFSLLNLLGDFRVTNFDANLWWIDLRFLPSTIATLVLVLVSLILLAFAINPPVSKGRQLLTGCCALLVAVLALINAGQFYGELFAGNITSQFPVPLSLFVCAAFLWVARAAFRPHATVLYFSHALGVLFATGICAFFFPVLQTLCFGKTDYRRSADVIVVLGARAYADGRPSDALADRVRTAVDLYKQGHARKIIMSGGPGDGAIHETEAMRRMAVELGVVNQDIYVDEQGLNTLATVKNTEAIFEKIKARRVLVVSHFYHLPRIKMTYQREGWDVYTVPAKEAYFLRQTPYMVLREVPGLWVYYLRPLKAA